MKVKMIKRGVPVLLFAITFSWVLTFAADREFVTIQGKLMEVDLTRKIMIVNEKPFIWDQNTLFHNERNAPASQYHLKAQSWVYVQGEYDRVHKRVLAKKIYLLPKRIPKSEQHLYPFLQ